MSRYTFAKKLSCHFELTLDNGKFELLPNTSLIWEGNENHLLLPLDFRAAIHFSSAILHRCDTEQMLYPLSAVSDYNLISVADAKKVIQTVCDIQKDFILGKAKKALTSTNISNLVHMSPSTLREMREIRVRFEDNTFCLEEMIEPYVFGQNGSKHTENEIISSISECIKMNDKIGGNEGLSKFLARDKRIFLSEKIIKNYRRKVEQSNLVKDSRPLFPKEIIGQKEGRQIGYLIKKFGIKTYEDFKSINFEQGGKLYEQLPLDLKAELIALLYAIEWRDFHKTLQSNEEMFHNHQFEETDIKDIEKSHVVASPFEGYKNTNSIPACENKGDEIHHTSKNSLKEIDIPDQITTIDDLPPSYSTPKPEKQPQAKIIHFQPSPITRKEEPIISEMKFEDLMETELTKVYKKKIM